MNDKIREIFFGKNVKFLGIGATVLIILFVIIKVSFINNVQLSKAVENTISNTDVRGYLFAYGVNLNSTVFADSEYNLLAKDWVVDNAQPDFKEFLFQLGFNKWEKNNSDCDDFAKAFTVFLKSYVKKSKPKAASPAVGEVYYIRRVGGAHAINIIVLADSDGAPTLAFFEPQEHKFVNLTLEEIQSIYFISI